MNELKSWFLRNVLEAAERQLGANALANFRARLPPRLAPHASLERLRASAVLESVPLEEGEELLLALDSLLGDGSGKILEGIGCDLATRVLSQGGGVARTGDLFGTVARLQAFLEHPFVGATLVFEPRRVPTGFTLTVAVLGHSRATRALRHLTIGAIHAAERFAREAGAENLKLHVETIGDRARISARYLLAEESVPEETPPPSRRVQPVRAPAPSLSDEVERILRTSSPPRASEPPASAGPPSLESTSLRNAISSPRLPTFSLREQDEPLPDSTTLRRGERTQKKPDGTQR